MTNKQNAGTPAYFDHVHLKVKAYREDHEHEQTSASFSKWAGGLMRSCATSKVKDLKPRDVVSFKVPHEQTDVEHVGTIVDTDPHAATVTIQEHVPSDDGTGWTRTGTTHVVRYSDVTDRHTNFLESEDSDDTDETEQVKAAFHDYFFSATPKRKRK
jgi:hypothetical protein